MDQVLRRTASKRAITTEGGPATGRTHLVALDGLRGLAALTVFAFHVTHSYFAPSWVNHGYLAVDIFFVLSGFVVASAYEKKLGTTSRPLLFFAEVRFVRLYPMIVLGALAGAALNLARIAHTDHWPKVLAEQLLFIPSIHSGYAVYPLNIVQWSVAWEILANVAHALFLRKLGVRALAAIGGISGLLLVYVAFRAGDLNQGATIQTAFGGAPRVAFSYVAGILLYRFRHIGAQAAPSWTWPLPFLAFLLAASTISKVGTLAGATQDALSVLVVFPAAVWLASRTHLPRAVGAVATEAGRASYPLYAIQGAMMTGLFFTATEPLPQRLVWWIPAFVGTVLLAWLIDRYVDTPIQRLRRAIREPSLKAFAGHPANG